MSKWIYNNDVIGSSNLKDITDYCQRYGLTYLTTFDFLYYAVVNKLISTAEVDEFIRQVKEKDSKLPDMNDFAKFVSKVVL